MSILYNQSFLLKLLFAICVLAGFSQSIAFGQQEQFKFRHLTIKNGLSDHEVTDCYRDSRGFIWSGTSFGLNRFDGYKVRQFLHDARDTTSLPDNWVSKIFETPDKHLGVLTMKGLALYDHETEKFSTDLKWFDEKYGTSSELKDIVRDRDGSYWFLENRKIIKYEGPGKLIAFQNVKDDSTSIAPDVIADLSLDGKGNAWVVYVNGLVEKLTVKDGKGEVSDRIYSVYKFNRGKETNYEILSDTEGDLWFYAENLFQGILFFKTNTKELKAINQSSTPWKLNTNHVSSMIEARDGIIWIGTDHGGINVIDKRQKKVRYILHRDEDPRSLSENSVWSMYRDNQGIVWAGTYKRGISYYHENMYRFDLYKHYSLDPVGLPFEDINRFQEDSKGNLWIGTNGGGLLYFDRRAGTFKQYRHQPGNNNSISGDVIVSLWMDKNEDLWIGTYNAGLNKYDGKNFVRYKNVPGDTTSLPSQNIWDLYEDSKGRFWICTIDAGVAIMDKKTGKFHKWRSGVNAIRSPSVGAIMEDRKGRIWFGTMQGIDVLSADGKTFTHYETSAHENSLSNNRVLNIIEDSKGRIWIATMDGLNLFRESSNGFASLRHQLPHHSVMDIREDNAGKLWMSTLNGLCEMTIPGDDLGEASFRHYVESDGLQGTQFNTNAAFKTRAGELIFGGPTGFNIFSTQRSEQTAIDPIVTFTDLKLFQESVTIGERINGVVILPKSIANIQTLVLPPNNNFFSIELSSLNFFNPEKNRYLYKLEGLNQDWLKVDEGSHEISFSGLSPGDYKLRVKATDTEGFWSSEETVLPITVQPPFWKTNTAFVAYGVFFVCALILARKLIQQREKFKFALEQERQEVQRVHELDVLKVKFFTNVSHEFRTPLTLILTPLEKMIKNPVVPEQLGQLQLMQRNANRLMKLVNQLLDFKKLEVQEIKFDPSEGDIVAFVREVTMSFSDLAEKKNISLQFHSSVEHFETLFDADKLEKILFNLLGNAFKFTLDNGAITVSIERVTEDGGSLVQICVADTGIGMPSDKLEKIFEPFFQNDLPKSILNQGSGIGLAITKEFVRIHGGTINVTSEVGKGSRFTIRLPLSSINEQAQALPGPIVIEHAVPSTDKIMVDSQVTGEPMPDETKKLLLVEDDEDVRFYLKDNLKFKYKIYESRNGADAWEQVLSIHPDLIVSDVMMPELNGIDLCMRIKTDERVSHIPVILLTARSNDKQRLEGLKVGADDYITKPFNFEVLQARIENLITRQQKSQKSLRKTLDVKASELDITPLDEKFIEKAIKCVEDNISLPYFSVESLAEELGISRAYMFKKIQVLTGKTPLEFMRTIRLQHAAQLLEKSQLSVREVAYKVGFNNPKYFAKYFKEHFNVLPSNYAATKSRAESG